jgi:hypothetical protein
MTLTGDPGDTQPGPGPNAPVVDGQNLDNYGFSLASGVSNVTIQGFEIRNYVGTTTGEGDAILAWVASTSYVTVNDNYMHNLSWNGVLVGNDHALGLHTYWTIARNVVTDFGPNAFNTSGYGLELTNTSHGVIEDNIVNSGTSHFPGTGILVTLRLNSGQDILIQRNHVRGSYDFAAIDVQASTQDVSPSNLDDVRILDNDVDISGPEPPTIPDFPVTALRIRNKLDGTVTNVLVNYNKLISSNYGLINNDAQQVDATCNYWGVVSEADVAARISGDVKYYPWLAEYPTQICGVARYEKLLARQLMDNAVFLDDPKFGGDVKDIIKKIDESLDPQLWDGDDWNRLNGDGKKVFDKEKDAVKKLWDKLVKKWIEKDGIYNDVGPVAQEAMNHLINADDLLAQVAIADAAAACTDPMDDCWKELQKAQEEYAKAKEELGKDKYPESVDHFKHAWEHAIKSSKKAVIEKKAVQIPTEFALEPNYPNPFNPTTTISFALPVDATVSLAVYDVLGRRLADLVEGRVIAGVHDVVFDASNLSSGVYFYRLSALGDNGKQFTAVQKMLLAK